MDPYKQQPATSAEHDPYHFIMNEQHKPKKGLLPSADHHSLRGRLLVALGIGTALIIAFILFNSLVLGSKDKNAQSLVTLVGQQQEIIRVSDLGLKDATDSSTKAFVETVKLSVVSQQNALTQYLTKQKQKITPLQLAAKKNTQTDAALAAALKNNRFDDLLKETLLSSLNEYKTALAKDYDAASTTTAQSLLKNAYTSTDTLLK